MTIKNPSKAYSKWTTLLPPSLNHSSPEPSTLTSFIYSKISNSIPPTIPRKRVNSCSNPTRNQENSSISPKIRMFLKKCSKIQQLHLPLPSLSHPSLLPPLLEERVMKDQAFQTSFLRWIPILIWADMATPSFPKLISLELFLANTTMGKSWLI